MCLSTKGERASSQMKHFKQIISKSIAKYVAVVTIYTLANKHRTTFLPQFPQVLVFSVVSILYQGFIQRGDAVEISLPSKSFPPPEKYSPSRESIPPPSHTPKLDSPTPTATSSTILFLRVKYDICLFSQHLQSLLKVRE